MIRIFRLDSMEYTPFGEKYNKRFFQENNIVFTTKQSEADLYITRFMPIQSKKDLLMFRFRHKRFVPILIWTHEPRFNTQFSPHLKRSIFFPDVYNMNVYTQNIYTNNLSWHARHIDHRLQEITEDHFYEKTKNIAVLTGYIADTSQTSLFFNEINIDLIKIRQAFILHGVKEKQIDVYGKNWPSNISIEDSRGEGRETRKLELLRPYKFNAAFENTNFDYYVTEKIWDSIIAGCLPIYYGKGNKIYENFKKNSFVDYCDYSNNSELYKFINNMCVNEYCDRLNRCIETYNYAFENKLFEKSNKKSIQIAIDKIIKISSDVK